MDGGALALFIIVIAFLMVPIFYKLYKEDEWEYWQQFDEATRGKLEQKQAEYDKTMIEYRKVGKKLKDSMK